MNPILSYCITGRSSTPHQRYRYRHRREDSIRHHGIPCCGYRRENSIRKIRCCGYICIPLPSSTTSPKAMPILSPSAEHCQNRNSAYTLSSISQTERTKGNIRRRNSAPHLGSLPRRKQGTRRESTHDFKDEEDRIDTFVDDDDNI